MTGQIEDSGPDTSAVAAEVEFISAERLTFFSDAVAAIAMTLLAFTLKVPGGRSDHAILHGLATDRLSYLEFLISFVVIGGHWRSHHRLFRYVNRLDSRIITLNMIWLLMIVIIPFATRLLSGRGGFGVRFSVYAIVQILTVLAFLLMSRHLRGGELLRPEAPPPTPRDDDASLLTVAAMFAISIPVAFVPRWGQWAFVFWVASAPAGRVVRRRLARESNRDADSPAESGLAGD
ncbi:MAG TPA: TMEM175 family protein [Streptosporangiaceae bacterium]|nr:TMEM175 family protein [Streptosporangiaceae bacterium]